MTPRRRSLVWSVDPPSRCCWPAPLVDAAAVRLDDVDRVEAARPKSSPPTCICIPHSFALWDNLRDRLRQGRSVALPAQRRRSSRSSIFALQVLVALPAAYALAKLRFRGRDVLFALVLFCILIPPQATAIPVFLLLHKLGILDSYAALVLPFTISVFGIFLMRQFFKTVPDDLIDAARMDGISEFGIVWRVMLPTAIPALTAFGIFSVVAHWNDYFWPLIVLNSEHLQHAAARRRHFRNDEAGTNYGPLMAAAIVIIAPLVIAFLLAQRRFIEGITLTGIK